LIRAPRREGKMEIYYLPVEKLRLNDENFFKPLSAEEYKDLRESIARHGVEEPLIVVKQEDGTFKVICGNNRLKAAMDEGIKTLPCSIKEITDIEGALDTEIFRRHLDPQERARCKTLKEVKGKETLEKEMKKKLIPELIDQYKNGILSRESALSIMKISIEEQVKFFQSTPPFEERILPEDEEVKQLTKEIDDLKETLLKKNNEIKELKLLEEENKQKIENKSAELEEKKGKVRDTVKKEYEQEIKNLTETNEKLRRMIQDKEGEVENAKEEAEKAKRLLSDKEVRAKAAGIVFVSKENSGDPLFSIWLDGVIKSLEALYNHMRRYKDLSRQSSKVKVKITAISEILNKIENKVTASHFTR
jgi:ParB-like chromosome segregation protein Spo0J